MENKIDLVDDKTEVEKLCFETMRAIADELKKTRPNIENEFIYAWDQFDLGVAVDETLIAKFIRAYEGKVREVAEELDIKLEGIDEDKLSMLEDDIEEQLREAVQAVL